MLGWSTFQLITPDRNVPVGACRGPPQAGPFPVHRLNTNVSHPLSSGSQSDAITGRFPACQIKTNKKKPALAKQHRMTRHSLSSVPSSCVKNNGGEKIEERDARGQDRKEQTGREQRSRCFLLSSHIQRKW